MDRSVNRSFPQLHYPAFWEMSAAAPRLVQEVSDVLVVRAIIVE